MHEQDPNDKYKCTEFELILAASIIVGLIIWGI